VNLGGSLRTEMVYLSVDDQLFR